MSTTSVGVLSGTLVSQDNFTVTSSDPTDVFRFSLNQTRQIGLFLHDMTADADLYLYRDNNNNGLVDSSDPLLRQSTALGTTTDSIDYSATSGNYLAQVWRYSSVPSITYDLDLSSNFDIGSLGSSVISRDNNSVSASDPADLFELDFQGARNLNTNLHNISSGDDVDLYLYRDSNNNGIFDSNDAALTSATVGGNGDDLINYRTSSGGVTNYFVQARRYSGSGSATYNLDFSQTELTAPNNLLGVENQLGNLNGDITRSGAVSNSDMADIYAFQLSNYEGVNIRLDGMSADADIRLIRDFNNDRIIQSNEILRSSTNGGTIADVISNFNDTGSFYLQVDRYDNATGTVPATNYRVTFDHYNTTFV
ncbi:hypothetical protein ACL6C3_19265 [Capilliphycus salinus ALCB114379]|uniref:hypothetical protein n=1 Tax=Capilliphycus salinus TaxID=2768948 RepID=UPI0039A4C062